MSILLGEFAVNLTAKQPDAQVIIRDFKKCLADYRAHAEAWYGGVLDAEQQFQVGDEVATQDKDSKSRADLYANCPANGKLKLVHSFESARFVPIGNTPVRLVPVVDGMVYGKNEAGAAINVTIGPSGIKEVTGLKPNQQYKITFFPNPTRAQIDSLFNSYQGVIGDLSGWLQTEWSTDFLPLWKAHNNASIGGRALQQLESAWKGFLKAIMGLWGDIKSLYNLVAHPRENYQKLKKFFTEEEIKKIYNASKSAIHTALLIASDEPLMWIYVAAIVAWVKMLPPQTCMEVLAELTTEVLLNILIGIVLTGGIGLAVRVGTKALKATQSGGKVLKLIEEFTSMLMRVSRKNATGHAEASKPLLLNGNAALSPGRKATVEIAAPKPAATATPPKSKPKASGGAVETDAQIQARGKKKPATRAEQNEPVSDAPKQSTNPADKPARCTKDTRCEGDPISMVTGEELLTLTDGELDGLLPLEWTRLYRTSAVEVDNRLGFGWSHSLSHRLQINDEGVLWTDNENRQTQFPLPTEQRPAITNSLAEAAIFLGDAPGELILTQAGQGARFYHFRAGRLTTISDAYNNQLHVSYDLVDRIQRIDNGAGRSLFLRYDDRHIAAVDYQQRRPDYNEQGERQEPWLTVQTLVSYQYNEHNQLISATNAVGEVERYRYDEQHVIQERQLAGGASFRWEWEHEGKAARCIRQWSNLSQIDARYVWDDEGTVTVINADGSEQVYVHDENARLVSQTTPDGAETQKAYDEKGRLIAEKDPLGAITAYEYSEAGRLIAVIPPEDESTYYNYFDGHLIEVRRGNAQWKYERNDQGDITQQTDPDGNETHYRYDRQGRLLEITHPDGSRHQLGWNGLGQLLEERLPDGGQRKYRYDALGRQITRQDESGAITHYQWDAANRLAQITLPGGATRAFSYNAYGKVTAERDELGRITRYEYADNLHLVSRRINPDGSQLRYRYDNARLLLTDIENERGEQYHLDYYPNGLIQQETGFDGRSTAYAYDLNGNLLKKTEFGDDGSELVTEYQRDAAGRLLVKTLADGEKIHYSYDALGRLVNVDDGHWPLAYEYDLQDRLITEHQGWGTLRYEYDKLGQLSHCRLPDGSKLDYRHAPGGQLSSIDLNGSRLTSHQFNAGREQQRQQGLLLSQYQYDEQGRLQAHSVSQQQHGQHQNLYRRAYAYDANGNLAGIDDSRKGNLRYHYDPLDRLINVRGATPESFAHDPAGNLLGQGDQPAANLANVKGNRLLMQGDRHYDYDAFGNLSRERRGAGQKLVTEYQYDCQHRLIGVSLPGGSTATYKYDAFGRRIAKTVDGRTTEFLWQGEQLIAESAENRYRTYIYEPDSFRPLAMLDGEGPAHATPFYYQLDHLGTPQELTAYSGEIMWSAKYRAYGNLATLDVSEIDNPLRFQGQYFDTETGLHYNRHRYYNPSSGRFLTPDPIKLAGGLNNYQYVPNPTGWVDPLGLSGCLGQDGGKTGNSSNPAAKATVDERSPKAPAPQMTAQQRQARIEELSEANAKRRVQELEAKYNMHTVGKHGPEIPDATMRQRAIDGTDPITGTQGRLNKSSQFKTWKLHLNALNEALTRKARGLPAHTGFDRNNNPIVRVEQPGAGRGYKPNRRDPQNPILNENMNGAEIKFDRADPDRPFTAFPID
ncbi:type IV secretion protein Rhs [Pseudomonas chlororaphis]|uniref:RHS repeat-associated core domain-containing protein n=1 Tax=Pseudomonas chlororaphis TaxID=587753 RepID=UPI000789DE53|nr:RHS repeat-associated core domain-containing protein [Pseudomonas chlororaphis]AMS14910.1 type IV secretion protein Rhs [Pseudomonas chlororaphis]